MSDKVAEISEEFGRDGAAVWIAQMWDTYNRQRAEKLEEWAELDKYLFATDTTTTSNSTLPWKNSTTNPKITQIRDNLHANYISALFPNDNWLQWQAFTEKDAMKKKKDIITAYMDNKTRLSGFRTTVSRLVLDYIDRGNAFALPVYENRVKDSEDNPSVAYVGPKLTRIAPEDIVFNPLMDFEHSPKIVRSVKTIGELKKLAITNPDEVFWEKAIQRRAELSDKVRKGGISQDDFHKVMNFQVDGFGDIFEYMMGNYVEILEFWGDYHNAETGELKTNQLITVVDRSIVVRQIDIPTYDGTCPIKHVGWRFRPNNAWAMGPLDNLVGLQYRLDHLENARADAYDLAIHAPLKIQGEVEAFDWAPGAEIHIDENGDVSEVLKNIQAIIAGGSEMQAIEDRMELYAGAPREAMGIRTPGEKTAFEIQALENAAGRIFQEKSINFEVNLLEPTLNDMFMMAHKHFDATDVIRVVDDDLGVEEFKTITKDDITASGKLRPVGARHFAKRAQDLQNVVGVFGSPIAQILGPHTSAIALSRFIEDVLDIRGYKIFTPNIAVAERQDTAALSQQADGDLFMQGQNPAVEVGG